VNPARPRTRPAARLGAVVALLLAGSLVWTHAAAADSARSAPVHPAPSSVNGETLGSHPTLNPGQLIDTTVAGFAALATVDVGLACRLTASAPTRADQSGRVHIAFRIPDDAQPGNYVLTISGQGRLNHPSTGNVLASVPRAAFYPFTIRGSSPAPVTC
jgi:hypothetical protein